MDAVFCATFFMPIFVIFLGAPEFTLCQEVDTGCDPEVATTCFSDVQDDLRAIFNPSNYYSQSRNETLLQDLCSAWDDSLSCTSDIIDTDCAEDTGRNNLDRWNVALKKTWEYVCSKNATVLNEILRSVSCFSMLEFFECTEKTANLVTIKDLMTTALDENECRFLQASTRECSEYVSHGTCAEEPYLNLQKILDVFFHSGYCVMDDEQPSTSASNDDHSSGDVLLEWPPPLIILPATSIISVFYICF